MDFLVLAALRAARAPPRDPVPDPVQSGMLLAGDVPGTMPEQIHPLVYLGHIGDSTFDEKRTEEKQTLFLP